MSVSRFGRLCENRTIVPLSLASCDSTYDDMQADGRLENCTAALESSHKRPPALLHGGTRSYVPMMRILLVEDDRNLRGFLRKAFREEGYTVDEAASGDEALDRALGDDYDCIVLDVMLPGRDGFDVLAHLRERGVATPTLLLTARHELEDRVRGLEGGADDYVTKPFDLPELLARVAALIRRAHLRHEDTTLAVGGLRLDPLNRRVTRDDVDVDLTPREFALLEFLMRNAGRTMSRSRIAEAVWNYQFDPETNVVDVYINYLRKKIGSGNTVIQTVRGVGYRLEVP